MLTEEKLREVIGDWSEIDYFAVLETANADPHEGAEWLPYYKAAMAILAEECGGMAAILSKMLVAYGDNPAGKTIRKTLERMQVFWLAHLKLCGIGPQTDPAKVAEANEYAAANMPHELTEEPHA